MRLNWQLKSGIVIGVITLLLYGVLLIERAVGQVNASAPSEEVSDLGDNRFNPESYPGFSKLKKEVEIKGYKPTQCTKQGDAKNTESYRFTEAAARRLLSPVQDVRDDAYYMLLETELELIFPGEKSANIYTSVFCGPAMEIALRHCLGDAFGNSEHYANGAAANRQWRNRARQLLVLIGAPEAMPFFEARMNETRDRLEQVELLHLWLQLNQHVVGNSGQSKRRVLSRLVNLINDWPDTFKKPVINRAVQYYQEQYGGCREKDGCVPGGISKEEVYYFESPVDTCPPDSILKELNLENCPS